MPIARVAGWVAAEILAVSAAMATQANQGASARDMVEVAVGVTVLLGFLFGLYKWAQTPFAERRERHVWKVLDGEDGEKFDRLVFKTLERNPEKFSRVVFRTHDRDDDARAIMRRFIERLFSPELAVIAKAEEQIEANKDAITFLRESNERQGEAITRELTRAINDIAAANTKHALAMEKITGDQTRAIERIAEKLEHLSKAYERMDERMTIWGGEERRHKPR